MKEHLKRLIEFNKDLIPEKGTEEYKKVKAKIDLFNLQNPNAKKINKLNFKEAVNTLQVQDANKIGKGIEYELRHYLREFNSRSWNHGHRSMPLMFNVMEAFFNLEKRINSWILLDEEHYEISLFDFIDYYTSKDFKFNLKYHIDNFEEDLIYHFHVEDDLKKITFRTSENKEFVIAGVSLVRRGDEVSMFFLTGEITDTKKITKKLAPITDGQILRGKENLKPDKDLVAEAVKLNNDPNLWKVLIACRFDLETETIDIRYVAKDRGDSHLITTDDVSGFMRNGTWISDSTKEIFISSVKEIESYNPIFELAKAVLYLPMYFNENEESIFEEECKTQLHSLIKSPLDSRKYNNVKSKFKIRTRHIWKLDTVNLNFPDSMIIRDDNFKIENKGYYQSIDPEKIGMDKKGRPVKGRNWISQTISYYKPVTADLIIEKGSEKAYKGKNAGAIYILRNASFEKNIFKIGLTRKTTKERASQLSNTSVPDNFNIINEWNVKDCVIAEKKIHEILKKYRVNPNREFFKIELKLASKVVEEVTTSINKELE
ncbi:GIY-YIG nuclease family protein [Arenibacter sp. F20364]|uniref:GIY-YIG nuclease family protein n=1 Tax=Arenibacter sp. F20364 TaxID=2926415 RepID=UPI001FF441E3|nr:GIY-YIG nuclease family protein [Arenibacter sp. F20364]MCK0190670.1 GIY-YIG nuclease family protein [Arenibacter sp. F20364]